MKTTHIKAHARGHTYNDAANLKREEYKKVRYIVYRLDDPPSENEKAPRYEFSTQKEVFKKINDLERKQKVHGKWVFAPIAPGISGGWVK